MKQKKSNNETVIKKAYIYTRVSSEEQVTNFSLDNQLEYCQKEAFRQGYEVIKVYREEGQSAKTINRPQLLQMLDDCRKNKAEISAIFIYKIDRISRETYDYLAIKKKLADYAIRIISVTEPTENSPTGEFLETLLAASAKLDNATKSLRTLDGMRKRIESGLPNGKAPVGYLNVTRDEKQVLEPDPEQFDLVKKAWEEMATGRYSLITIVPYLQKLGIVFKSGNKRIPVTRNQQTQRIFRNKIYAGYVINEKFGIHKRGSFLPMIPEDLFYKVQSNIDGRAYTAGVKHNRQNESFPLRGVYCNMCGLTMTGSFSKGRHDRYPYYFCNHSKHKSPSLKKDDFELEFLELVEKVQPKPEFINLFTEMVKEKWKSRYSHLDRKQKTVEAELEGLSVMRKKLVAGHLKGIYSDDVYKEQIAEIEHEILVKNTVKSEAKLQEIDIDIVVNFMNSFLGNLAKAWKDGNLQQRRILHGSIFPKNVTYQYPGFRTAELGRTYELINHFSASPSRSWVLNDTYLEPIIKEMEYLRPHFCSI